MTRTVPVTGTLWNKRGKKQTLTKHLLGSSQAFFQLLPCAISFSFHRNPVTNSSSWFHRWWNCGSEGLIDLAEVTGIELLSWAPKQLSDLFILMQLGKHRGGECTLWHFIWSSLPAIIPSYFVVQHRVPDWFVEHKMLIGVCGQIHWGDTKLNRLKERTPSCLLYPSMYCEAQRRNCGRCSVPWKPVWEVLFT